MANVLQYLIRSAERFPDKCAVMDDVCRIITRLPVVTDREQKRLCGRKQLLYREDLRMHRLSWNGLMHRLKEMARKIWRFAVIFWHGDWLWLRK